MNQKTWQPSISYFQLDTEALTLTYLAHNSNAIQKVES